MDVSTPDKPNRIGMIRSFWTKVKQKAVHNRGKLLITVFLVLFFIVFFAPSMFVVIEPGHVGVLFRPLWGGTVTKNVYREGLQAISPWNTMYIYDTRIQTLRQEVNILSQNGLTVKVTASVRYHIIPADAAKLHKAIGPEYRDKIIVPSTISSVREVIGNYKPEELYTTAKKKIEDDILVEEVEQTGRIPIVYDDFIVENIQLPAMINMAIEAKIKQQQEYLSYEFRLSKEMEEAKRKQIEAQGIKNYQEIISRGLSPEILRYLGIQATLDLARSPNAKVVVIGNGKEGLPLILNAPETPMLPGKNDLQPEVSDSTRGSAVAVQPAGQGGNAASAAEGTKR